MLLIFSKSYWSLVHRCSFRLPSALDNRPLQINEFLPLQNQIVHVSATPGDKELELCGGEIIEQIIRPTGLLDPKVEVRKTEGQIDDIIANINDVISRKEKILITTLTKKMAEKLTDYLNLGGYDSKM